MQFEKELNVFKLHCRNIKQANNPKIHAVTIVSNMTG